MNKSLSIDPLKVLLAEMEKLQAEHPKAKVLYDIARGRIEITYPLPHDFIKVVESSRRHQDQMIAEDAIKKSIEGGWEIPYTPASEIVADYLRVAPVKAHALEISSRYPELAFLDPSFWRSLGKAMGWKEYPVAFEDKNAGKLYWKDGDRCEGFTCPEWFVCWHRFIDHLAEGGTAETFFQNLS